MQTPWPQLALFLVAVSLAVAAGASVGPASARGGHASRVPEAAAAASVRPPRTEGVPRTGPRFVEPPAPPTSDAGGGLAVRDVVPPRPPQPSSLPPPRFMGAPVAGVDPLELPDTFGETARGRLPNGLDIPAPRGTPALAVADGTVQRLVESDEGGHTVYVLDASGQLRYFYAHLQGYREGLEAGDRVHAGELIGYVGDSGNAVPGETQLHFAVFRLDESPTWGHTVTPVNPLPYLHGEEPLPR